MGKVIGRYSVGLEYYKILIVFGHFYFALYAVLEYDLIFFAAGRAQTHNKRLALVYQLFSLVICYIAVARPLAMVTGADL